MSKVIFRSSFSFWRFLCTWKILNTFAYFSPSNLFYVSLINMPAMEHKRTISPLLQHVYDTDTGTDLTCLAFTFGLSFFFMVQLLYCPDFFPSVLMFIFQKLIDLEGQKKSLAGFRYFVIMKLISFVIFWGKSYKQFSQRRLLILVFSSR